MSPVSDFFTDRDDSITGSSQSDPMGLDVIWAGFASRVYRTRVNSIVNDLRGYTVNLFHHWMVRRIRAQRDPRWWTGGSRSKFQEGDHPSFSRALLVTMEKILLYSFCQVEDRTSFDEDALIGLSNARNALQRSGKRDFKFVLDETRGEILSRQSQLGFSGRYRTPFTRYLCLLEASTGHPSEVDSKWDEIEDLFQSSGNFRKLAQVLEGTLRKILEQGRDEFTAASFEPGVEALYVKCFGNRSDLEGEFAAFWNAQLLFQEGELQWLWSALPEEGEDMPTPEVLYHRALGLATEAGRVRDAIGIRRIIEVEPYLARLAEIFDGLLWAENQSAELAETWVRIRFGERPLQNVKPEDLVDLIGVLEGQGKLRLGQLFAMRDLDAGGLVQAMVAYHKGISEYRNSEPWIQVIQDEWRRNQTIKASGESSDAMSPQPWIHSYYGWQFMNLAQSIQRGLAR
jgi:hypothetical protein